MNLSCYILTKICMFSLKSVKFWSLKDEAIIRAFWVHDPCVSVHGLMEIIWTRGSALCLETFMLEYIITAGGVYEW